MTANDLSIYSNYADEWWIEDSPHFRSLKNITPFRLSLIKEMIGDLAGKTVLDMGCGGGLIAVPLLDAGALVTGVDQSPESIAVAEKAAKGRGRFYVGDICSLSMRSESFDCVLMADVLDHIPQFSRALSEASRLLKPGGKLFVGTLNRTWIGWFFTILLGESLGYIPKSTHAYKLFIRPDELIEAAASYDLELLHLQGEWPLLFRTIKKGAIALRKSRSTSVAYSALFQKR